MIDRALLNEAYSLMISQSRTVAIRFILANAAVTWSQARDLLDREAGI